MRHESDASEDQLMVDSRPIEQAILAKGRVDAHDLEVLSQRLYADGKIGRREADFLAELHKRVQHLTPDFEHFFYQAVKDHVLTDGGVDADEAAWLRQLLFAGGKLEDQSAGSSTRSRARPHR